MTGIFVRRERFEDLREAQGRSPYDNRGKDWSDVATKQEVPGIAGNNQKLEEAGKDFFLETLEGAWPVDT